MSKVSKVRILSRNDGSSPFTFSKTLAKRSDMRQGWMIVTTPTDEEIVARVPEDKIRDAGEEFCRKNKGLSNATDRQIYRFGMDHWRDALTEKETQLDKLVEKTLNHNDGNEKYQEAMNDLHAAQQEIAALRAKLGVASPKIVANGVTVVDEAKMPEIADQEVPDFTPTDTFVPQFATEKESATTKSPKRKG